MTVKRMSGKETLPKVKKFTQYAVLRVNENTELLVLERVDGKKHTAKQNIYKYINLNGDG